MNPQHVHTSSLGLDKKVANNTDQKNNCHCFDRGIQLKIQKYVMSLLCSNPPRTLEEEHFLLKLDSTILPEYTAIFQVGQNIVSFFQGCGKFISYPYPHSCHWHCIRLYHCICLTFPCITNIKVWVSNYLEPFH